MNYEFENIVPWNGANDTGRDVRLKWKRNFERIKANFEEVLKALDEVDVEKLAEYFMRKDQPDSTQYLVKFLDGIELGKFVSGLLGTGGAIRIDQDGNSHAEFDYLTIRKLAIFIELIIQEAKHVGGMLVVSPSGMTISKVEETDTAYRCYFERTDGDRTLQNQFTVGTQARRQTFNLTEQAYYWRLVTAVGDDYVDLSKTDCDTGSTIPQVGDELVGLGHRTDKTRQAAIIISAFGTDSPSIKYFQGIDSYNLVDRAVKMDYYDPVSGRFKSVTYGDSYVGAKDESTYMKYDQDNGVEVKGVLHIENGSTGAGNLSDLPEEVQKAAQVGSVNLLLNSGFTGNYETEELDADTQLTENSELYSKALLHWSGMASVQEDSEAASGRSAVIGSLSQSVTLIPNESYVISYKAKGTQVAVSCGSFSVSQPLTSAYQRYVHKFTFTGTGVFLISGAATVCELQLERGTIATDWSPSPQDSDKGMSKFQTIQYIYNAMKDGSVDMLGGLILATMIMVGNYKDGVLQQVTAGISGIYNDDNDVFAFGGGTLEQAIYTVMKYAENPLYQPSDAELLNMAKVVITHGGRAILNDVIVRGYIYALGGFFRGKVETAVSGNRIVIDPSVNAIQMFDNTDNLIYDLSFDRIDAMTVPKMIVRGYIGGTVIAQTEFGANGLSGFNGSSYFSFNSSGLSITFNNGSVNNSITFNVNASGKSVIRAENLLTESEATLNGQLYTTTCGFIKSKGDSSDNGYTGEVLVDVNENERTYLVVENGIIKSLKNL